MSHTFELKIDEILESITDAFYAVDSEWRLIYINNKAESYWHRSRKDLLGTILWDMFPEPQKTVGWKMHHEAMESRKSVYWETFSPDLKVWIGASAYPSANGGIVIYSREITERKRAEEALWENDVRIIKAITSERQRFFNMLEELPVMVCLITPDYHIPYANKAFREKFGEADGRHCFEYCCGFAEPCPFCESLVPLKTGKPHHWEFTSPDGNTIIDAHDFPFNDIDGTVLILEMDVDITERRQAEEALRESERKFREMAETVNSAFWISKFENTGDLKYLYLSPGFERIFGIPIEQIYNNPREWVKLIHPDDSEHFFSLQKSRANGENVDSPDFRIVRPDGTLHWIRTNLSPIKNEEGKISRYVGIADDITERKKAEEALRESEEKYRELVKHAPTGIYELDFRTDRFVSINDVMCELTGYSREEFLKMSPDNLLDEEGKATFKNRVDQWLRGEEPGPSIDYKIKTKNGDEIYASLNIRFTKDEKGRPLGAMVIAHDVTDRRKIEEALRKSEEELRQADKNKNTFLSALSHELRNPLAAISAGLQLMDIMQNKDKIKTVKGAINRQMNQLCALVDDLLDLTRITNNKIELKKERIELNRLALSTAEDQYVMFDDKEIKLYARTSTASVYLDADPVRLKQIIGNLLHNARKYTQTGGEAVLSVYEENKEAVISVKDNGIGLSPEMLPKLFIPFTQADTSLDRSNGGLGLGLSITKGIAQLHGGTVSAYSEGLGKGSEFIIRLPLSDMKGYEEAIDAKKSEAATRLLKVLVIEDNKDFAAILNMMLAAAGHDVLTSVNGRDGIEKAKGNLPDIILCDIGLPGMNGYEVARQIKSEDSLKNIILIALTGYAGRRDIELSKEAGFDYHLAKPLQMETLQNILRELPKL